MKFIAGLLLLASLGARANECAGDAKKFCAGVETGRGQLARCLSDYQESLAPKCAAELRAYKQDTGKKNPCFEDLAEFCADVPSDPANFEYCLLRNESQLGPRCATDFRAKKGKLLVQNVCAQDVASLCYAEVSGPEGAVPKCLIRNRAKLSGHCQKNIDARTAELRKKNPCFDDTTKFCPAAVRFIDIQDCLTKKGAAVAPACRKLVDNENVKIKANPCYRDLITHCRPGISPREQDDCLRINDEHLSNACRQFRVVEKTKVESMVKLCENDRLKLCKDAPFKDGAVVKCLRQHRAQVSPPCQKLL
jgi:hypothetical protein